MSAPTPVTDLRAAAVFSILAVAMTFAVWPALYDKIRRDDEISPDGTESHASSTTEFDASSTIGMSELELMDMMTYDHMRLEMLNKVLKFIEELSVDIPALHAQGLEVNAIIDKVMAVTN
ncbi:hypothetical protein FA95DRAFT_1598404 [Auriscalpium vulgare]|uniref:Uncharacterized protein n=1 Tax=Auriscalpium vulgare TaxID=40419 RepID=A0ACB8RG76_9AGAM|nr:hypothetical protein FA95DRAFT_1598404 [Auriscalpium vulgare]